MSLPIVRLKPLRPHRYGHPWLFAQEIASQPTDITNGDWVQIIDHNGKDAGIGYFNAASKIVVRRVANAEIALNAAGPSLAWWTKTIEAAYEYRIARGLVARNCYRLIHAEGDGIPGLIVDVYGDFVAVQLLTLGIDRQKELITQAIESVLTPEGIYERSDAAVRKLEGLEEHTGILTGTEPPDRIQVDIGGISALIDIKHGGKTGLFLDQIGNQIGAASEAKGRDVLNVFSYTGLFGLRAAAVGAKSVEDIESSQYFLEIAKSQWASNPNITSGCRYSQTQGNAFDELRKREVSGYLCDMVILDPPAFTKNRAGADSAARGYNEINRRAMKLLRPGGVLITCSCTHHIDFDEFADIVALAGRDAKKELRIIERRGQGPDHPILFNVPETDYLKYISLSVS